MSTDISHLSAAELNELARNAEALAAKKHIDGMNEARDELAQIAKDRGYTITELFGPFAQGAAKAKPKGSKAAPKYRDPATGATWTGKGRRPDWVNAHLDLGGTLAGLLIAGGA
jgi:DNA-binding protein H-NS